MRLLSLLGFLSVAAMGLSMPFTEFIKKYEKVYDNDEVGYRLEVYKKNLEEIERHNGLGLGWRKTVTKFADMTATEFQAMLPPLPSPPHLVLNTGSFKRQDTSAVGDLPTFIDWRLKGAITPVKDQKNCGSCWAFSTAETLETTYFLKTGKLLTLSKQQLVDCSKQDKGCSGGLPSNALTYVEKNGITSEDAYPYTGVDGKCQKKKLVPVVHSTSHVSIAQTQEALIRALNITAVSVAVQATNDWQLYGGGVLDAPCGQSLNHAIQLVGLGELDGKKYWLVRNSWGTSWGGDQRGYMLLSRDIPNQCGILNMAVYPVI